MKPWMVAIVLMASACSGSLDENDAGSQTDPSRDVCPPAQIGRNASSARDASAPVDACTLIDASTPTDASASIDAHAADAQTVDAFTPDPSTPVDAYVPPDPGSSRSAGCGTGDAGGTGDFETRTIHVVGRDRTYRLRVPASYDDERAYPIVFRWHGFGGDGLSGGLGIEYAAGEDAIIVSPDAVGGAWDLGSEGIDVALFDALLDEVSNDLCVDLDRVFSYGFSRGGGMTNLLACTRPGVIRATAAVAGLEMSVGACSGPVAAWFLHDTDDGAVPIGNGTRSRDRFLTANGCGDTSTATDPSPCVRYDGCTADHPVVWCETSGRGHDIRGDFAPAAVWSFFSSLP